MSKIQGLFDDYGGGDDDDGDRENENVTAEIITGITRDGTQIFDNSSGKAPPPPKPKTVSLEDQSAVPVHPTKRGAEEEGKEDEVGKEKEESETPQGSTGAAPSGSIIHEMLTHVPEGLRDQRDDTRRFRYDVESRPDEATAVGYESMPVEEYGEAMLRGLGWEPGKPIGLHATEAVEPIVAKKRPGFHLGLGATEKDVELRNKLKELQRKGIDIDKAADEYANKEGSTANKADGRSRKRSRSRSRDRRHRSRDRNGSRSRSPRGNRSRNRNRSRSRSRDRRSRNRSRSRSRSGSSHRSRSRDRSSHYSRHHHHHHSHHDDNDRKQRNQSRDREDKPIQYKAETNFERGHLFRVFGNKKYDGRYCVAKDTQAGQVLARLYNTDPRVLGAQEVWLEEGELRELSDPRDAPRDVARFWRRLNDDRTFMEALTSDEILRDYREKQAAELREAQAQLDRERAEKERRERLRQDGLRKGALPLPAGEPALPKPRMIRTGGIGAWVEPDLVVRVVSKKKYGSSLYLKKARVVDVTSPEVCTIELFLDPGKRLVEGVAVSALETVVPQKGGCVLILNGELKGLTASVVEKKKETVVMQTHGDLEYVEMALDDVCYYLGPQRLGL